MALSGTIFGTCIGNNNTGQYYEFKIVWSATQNKLANSSTITSTTYLRTKNLTYTTQATWTPIVQGVSKPTLNLNINSTSFQKLADHTWTVYHDAQGKLTLTLNASFTGNNNATYALRSGSASQSVTLDTIPREASILLELTNDESAFKYTTDNPAGFNLEVTLKVGGQTLLTSTSASLNRLLTSQELDILYTNSTTTSTPTITAEVKSYSGTTLIGTKTDNKTVQIINANPLFSDFTYSDTLHSALTGNNQIIILNASSLQITASATAQKKATITGYRLVNGDNSITVSGTGTLLKPTSSITQVIAEDSRGNSTVVSKTMSVINYQPIVLKELIVERVTDGEAPAKITADGSVFVGSFGAVSNTLNFRYWFRETGTTEWVLGNTVITTTLETDWNVTKQINGDLGTLGFTLDKQFDIKLEAYDRIATDIEERILLVSIDAFSVSKNYGGYQVTVGCARDDIAGLKVKGRIRSSDNNVYIPFEVGDVKMTFNNVDPAIKYGGTWTLWKTEASCYYWRRTA